MSEEKPADAAARASLEMTELSQAAITPELAKAAAEGFSMLAEAVGTDGGNAVGAEQGSSTAAVTPMQDTAPPVSASIESEFVIAKGFRIRETSQGPTAKYARFTCDSCKGMAYVEIPAGADAEVRSKLMKAAVDEHRFVCSVGLAEDMRVYRIEYPR